MIHVKMAEKTRTISSSGESESEIGHDLMFNSSFNSDNNSIMNTSQISTTSTDSHHRSSFNITHGVSILFQFVFCCLRGESN